MYVWYIFFFKQKTAYEMRISDWSSDVCSSDLTELLGFHHAPRIKKIRQRLAPATDCAAISAIDRLIQLQSINELPVGYDHLCSKTRLSGFGQNCFKTDS